MDLGGVKKETGAWYDALPGRGEVYDLAELAVSGKTTEERLRAVTALGKSDDPRAIRPLMELTADPDPTIRSGTIAALGQLKSGRPVEVLIARLRDRAEHHDIRCLAAETLAAIRSTGALRELREFVADEGEDAGLRSYASGLLDQNGIA
ncbi:MAG: HEAT repeat domain-containing protein [Methanoregula sp.]|jgi:hypothetical protein